MTLLLIYNWRNLRVRRLSSSLTLLVVAVVTAVLCVLLSFAAGIAASLAASGRHDNLMVLKPGATAESTSLILPEEANRLVQTPGLALSPAGQPLISRELSLQTNIPHLNSADLEANVAVRGVDPEAFLVHSDLRIPPDAGRMLQPGAMEVIVGKAAHERFRGLGVGQTLALGPAGNRLFTIVGIFESGGSAFESEVWGWRSLITDAYKRRFISSVVLRLANPHDAQHAIDYIRGGNVNLAARREPDYYHELSAKTREIVTLTTILITIMAVGAGFAVANTMYAAVDGRRREIAMLRTLGFSRLAIILAFLAESALLCLAGAALGLTVGLAFTGQRSDFLSDATWTVLAFQMTFTPAVLAAAFGTALLVGLLGALPPALRASRVRVIDALRKA